MPITTLDDLRQHLQWAIELEHATLPPYLCALYSIKSGHNREATNVITSVLIEEMLHMTLAANVLNAIGGAPVIDSPTFMPRFPTYLPHSAKAFLVPLARFAPATVETFMKIEKPEPDHAPAEAEGYHTIGQFYEAIEESLTTLCERLGERQVFSGDRSRQITTEHVAYRASGHVVAVYDLKSALEAINEIEEQGEGLKHREVWDGDRDMFHPEREEVAHYFRFLELLKGRNHRRGDSPTSGPSGEPFEVDWHAVYPMRDNPRSSDFPEGSPVRRKMDEFNLIYSDILRGLQRAFNGDPASVASALAAMSELRVVAQALVQMPTGDGVTTAGPSFEYIAREDQPSDEVGEPDTFEIAIEKDGPYVVLGGVPLSRKSIVYSELHEPMTWRKEATLEVQRSYRLCRCGQSSEKPFCDNTHRRVGFDGTETAPIEPSESRREAGVGTRIAVTDDQMLCTRAGFCGNRVEKVWTMLGRTEDTRVRAQMMRMVEHCPSGRLVYELEDGPVEPDLPTGIAVTKDGPYWVTGGVPVTMSDGRPLEVRHRVTLCRCGQSSNKPLCDGTHALIKFREG